jgi:Rod binding domain-containing protein
MLYVNPIAHLPHGDPKAPAFTARKTDVALEEFEKLFLYQLMREMRRSTGMGALFEEKSPQQGFIADMLDDALAGALAESRQLGVADQIRAQLQLAEPRNTSSSGHQPPINNAPGALRSPMAQRYLP